MTLRLRLFLILLCVNLALLAIVQIASWWLQQRWLEQNRKFYESQIYEDTLQYAYGDYRDRLLDTPSSAAATVRRVLDPALRERFRTYFRDVVITSGYLPQAAVDLNPMGVAQRDLATFPFDEIRAGIRTAMHDRSLVRAGQGFCVSIAVRDRVVGGAWFEPKLPPPPQLPITVFAVPLFLGTVVFAALANWFVGGAVLRPLDELGGAARRVGEGSYDARMHRVNVPEIDVFIDGFNAMAARIEGHHAELEREVQRATEEAKRKERAMLQSARLAAMGTLAAGIAHEINNPIGGMLNAVRTLEKRENLGDRDRLYLELVREGLERVGAIARRVLDFGPRRIEAEPFRWLDAVASARALVDHRLRRQGVELVIDVPDDLPELVGDRHEFQQVLLNLFLNSLDVLEGRPAPGRIEVRARRAAGGGTEVVVADNGPGMPVEDLGRVVDPFYSGKGRPDASGLGMFISYSIVRNHGGELEVDSAPGQGFRTTIRMPPPE